MSASTVAIDEVFRVEWGRILAGLIRRSGSFEEAEDALQEAFATAIAVWPRTGIPNNPAAWITTAATRKLIDSARKRIHGERILPEIVRSQVNDGADAESPCDMSSWPDDRLRLIFTCCHPALNQEAQIALCLRTLGGLATVEIAKAFLLSEPVLAQRLVRAKRKIRDANIPYVVPSPEQMPERLAVVQSVVYLIFNEGYLASYGTALLRTDLSAEAIRLARLLTQLLPNEPENLGLLALMLFHHSRRDARTNAQGDLVVLEDQDRALWHSEDMQQGFEALTRAARYGQPGPYQVQAAIAAIHASATESSATDWSTIRRLYEKLLAWSDAPVVRLNHAVAVGMSDGLVQGLNLLDELSAAGDLARYHLLPAARADLLRRLGRTQEAATAYREALQLVGNEVERRFLQRRLRNLAAC